MAFDELYARIAGKFAEIDSKLKDALSQGQRAGFGTTPFLDYQRKRMEEERERAKEEAEKVKQSLKRASELVWKPEGAQERYAETWGAGREHVAAPFLTSPVGQFLSPALGAPGSGDSPFEAALMYPAVKPFAAAAGLTEVGIPLARQTISKGIQAGRQAGREIAPVARRLAAGERGFVPLPGKVGEYGQPLELMAEDVAKIGSETNKTFIKSFLKLPEEDKIKYVANLQDDIRDYERLLSETQANLQVLPEVINSNPISSWRGQLGNKRVSLLNLLGPGGDFKESFTLKEANMIKNFGLSPEAGGKQISKASIDKSGRVPFGYIIDEISSEMGMTENEFMASLQRLRTDRNTLQEAKGLIKSYNQEIRRLNEVQGIIDTISGYKLPETPKVQGMVPGTSAQTGFGIGEKPSSVKMFEEFTGKYAPEQTPLIDAAAIKAREAAKPLPGQVPMMSREEFIARDVAEAKAAAQRVGVKLTPKQAEASGRTYDRLLAEGKLKPPEAVPAKVPEVAQPPIKLEPPIAEIRPEPPLPEKPLMQAQPPLPPPPGKTAKAPVPPEKPEFAANIRLEKYPEEIRPLIKEWADANPEVVQEARRGVRSDAQVLADAKELVESVGGNFAERQRQWKAGQAWNAEEILALRGTLRNKTEAVLAAQKEAKSGSIESLLKLQLAMKEQAAIQESVHGVTAEAGRALRQFKQDAFNAFTTNDVEKMEEILKRIGGRAKTEEIVKALGAIDINDPDAVSAFIRNITKPRISDYITEIYYNSILSGPKTHIVNTMSNTVNALVSPIERAVAAAIEAPLARIQGRQVQRFFSEVPADAFGAIEGIKDGAKAWAYTMRHGRSLEQASKYEMGKAFTGKLGYVINFPSTNLEAADALMHQVNYRAALKVVALRQVKAAGLKGEKAIERLAELIANPTEQLFKEAEKLAEYRLFRTPPGKFTQTLMGLREDISVGGFKPLRFIIPFIRTPSNLLKYGLERSPAGWMNPYLWKNIIAKNPEAADQIGRAVLGSIGAATIAWYVHENRITGAAPTNPAERDRFYRDGKQPYSIRIGDNWVSYQRIEPFNQTFAQVAAGVNALKQNEKDAAEKAQQIVSTIVQNMVSQTYMSGVADVIDVVAQPERYAGNVFSKFATALLTPASSFTRTAAQMLDKTVRQPETMAQRFQAGIPGLSQNVPAKLDVMGQEIERKSPAWSPINISPALETPLTQELDRLKINIGFAGKTIAGIPLSPEEQRTYQIKSGQLINQRLTNLTSNSAYQNIKDARKEKLINTVIDKARDQVRADILRAIPLAERKRRKEENAKQYENAATFPGLLSTAQQWNAIRSEGGSAVSMALTKVWFGNGQLTPEEENLLKRLFQKYPMGQTNFKTWYKQTLRQYYDNLLANQASLQRQPVGVK